MKPTTAFALVLVLLLLVIGVAVTAQEKAELTTPIVTTKTVLHYEITGITLQRGTTANPDWSISISYTNNLGVRVDYTVTGATAQSLIVTLNKSNLAVKSLERRALEYLISVGAIPASSITGAPL